MLDILLEPLVYLSNLAVAISLYPAYRTARIQWEPDAAKLIRLFKERSRPIVCFAWHAYELNSFCAFRDFPRDLVPLAVGHDGPLSRALQQSAAWYDFPVCVYRRRSPIPPKAQIVNLLKTERPVIGVFPDSGGPDGNIRPGFLEVARAAEALLVPMAWHARPVLAVRPDPAATAFRFRFRAFGPASASPSTVSTPLPTSAGPRSRHSSSGGVPRPPRRRNALDGAGSPRLVLVREPDQLGIEGAAELQYR